MHAIRSVPVLTALAIAFALTAPRGASAADPAPLLQFNGKDLTGFYTYLHDHKLEDPDGVFTVVDGELRISGKEWGGVVTREEYENYHLVTEWKWGKKAYAPRADKARDSGILLHCFGADDAIGGHWMQSMECQIIEGGTGDFIVVARPDIKPLSLSSEVVKKEDGQWYYQPDGSGALRAFDGGRINWWGRDLAWKDEINFRGAKDVEKPAGEWNTLEVVCDGDSITNILNGQVVNKGVKSNLTKGKLTFQSEGAEIVFRKIEIRPLAGK
ncbi:DUF1080 domain-containing protein [Planctomyces sp. SH-PL62]|uniref:3-keto-disaccharide hydrolase n=1 Tax=Planctomyces sp. SH-PL62 TaxID=1636152 RepID=UPI00078E3675|nr:DUF1080 domain-containing protein [Planctomyces sp. SH-PL62]AMV40106.1 hypothetical protein VT85_21920 [Planctomyces sp. SH-PL62]